VQKLTFARAKEARLADGKRDSEGLGRAGRVGTEEHWAELGGC